MPTVTYATNILEPTQVLTTYTSNDETLPDVTELSNGGYVVAYVSSGYTLVDFYDADHNVMGSYRTTYTSSTFNPGGVSVTELSDGRVLVAWDDDIIADGAGIMIRLYSQEGVPLGDEAHLPGTNPATTSFEDPNVAAFSAAQGGGWVTTVTYEDDVYLFRTNADGTAAAFAAVNIATTGSQKHSDVTVLADGGYVVVYDDLDPSDQVVRAVIYNADNTIRTADFVLAAFGDNTQPSVVALQNGGFATVYQDSGWAEGGTFGNGISLQISDANGAYLTLVHVNNPSASDEFDPAVTVLDNGMIAVTWTAEFTGTDHDIYGALFDQSGNRIQVNGSDVFYLNTSTAESEHSSLAALLNGQFVTAWHEADTDVFGRVTEIVRTTVGDATDESLTGDSFHDRIFGGGGQDTIAGLGGLNEVHGEEGDDLILVDTRHATGGNVYDGGNGADTLRIAYASGGSTYADLRGDTLTSIERLGLSDPGIGGTAKVILNAAQLGGTGVSLTGSFLTTGYADVASTFEIHMEAVTSLNLSNITASGFQALDRVLVIGDDDAETIIGTSARDELQGNGGDDHLTGGGGNDVLVGGVGADTMIGGQGDDTYYVRDSTDIVSELAGEGTDTVYTTISFDLTGTNIENATLTGVLARNLTGSSALNVLIGNDANNVLDGLAGADAMTGGLGSDTYYVDNSGDLVTELSGQGANDRVFSTVTFNGSLANAAGIENITLTGSGAINAAGNALNNTITGNDANNGLNGGKGADTLIGGLGNDTYTIDSTGDVITELAGQGTDTVKSAISFTLSDTLENLTLVSTKAINGIGNAGVNVIVGGDGANILAGKGGADMLTGGAGADTFDYNSVTESSYSAYDRITDLTNADKIDLSGIDANSGVAGNQAFVKVGAFTHHAGEITLAYNAGSGFTVLSADVNGDGVADMRIVINGDHHTFTNFVF